MRSEVFTRHGAADHGEARGLESLLRLVGAERERTRGKAWRGRSSCESGSGRAPQMPGRPGCARPRTGHRVCWIPTPVKHRHVRAQARTAPTLAAIPITWLLLGQADRSSHRRCDKRCSVSSTPGSVTSAGRGLCDAMAEQRWTASGPLTDRLCDMLTPSAGERRPASHDGLHGSSLLRVAQRPTLRADPMTGIILDCDPGHNDAIALLLALGSPELQVLGVTTVSGNHTLEKTTAKRQTPADVNVLNGPDPAPPSARVAARARHRLDRQRRCQRAPTG